MQAIHVQSLCGFSSFGFITRYAQQQHYKAREGGKSKLNKEERTQLNEA